ncbi:glycosyltransferase family 2 protein [Serratia liquefaciens]|uniref:glycosyltransferase family 2 protein n=1 Tax=Serratia liquefaciens TaxID=614 RepID=UPI0010226F00|nr:glycosyltransferase family 2 protein [Serratia liquefaciens]RYM75081.1 glycosyl transferase family 2 [Serratia liquefaciens]RYM80485.1 glycosyl transferase family 2 [Serratia liquefaciens]
MKKIQVLLATYNGASFLKEQIDSVLSNFDKLSGFDCSILVSDDSSADETACIISDYKLKDRRVIFLDGARKGGVKANFNYLIQSADADYVFFCDQDDVWLDGKIKLFISKFELYGNEPLLIHSDLRVVDQQLKTISQSMFDSQKIFKKPTLGQLLVSNSVTGCVMAINHSLLLKVKNKRIEDSIMHDWYLALVAQCLGKLVFIDAQTILYRQHAHNQIGSVKRSRKDYFSVGGISKFIKKSRGSIMDTKKQSEVFLADFNSQLSARDKGFIIEYISSFNNNSLLNRLSLFLSLKVGKKGVIRNTIFFFLYVFK